MALNCSHVHSYSWYCTGFHQIWSAGQARDWLKSDEATESSQNPQLKETEIYYNNLVNSIYLEAKPLLNSQS